MDFFLVFLSGTFAGVCVAKFIQMIFRALTCVGYLIIVKNKHEETESILADLNIKPEQIKPKKWIWMRTQNIYLKEEEDT